MFRKGKSKVRISSVAYNAWGDPDKQKKAEKKIKKAINDGANPNDTDSKYFTAMHWAAEYNWPKVVHIVMVTERFSGIKTNLNARQGLGGRTALIMAVARGHAEVTEMLLKFGADIEVVHEGQTAVDIAIDNEDEAIYELLCAHHPELVLGANDSEEEEEDVDYEDALKELQTFTGETFEDDSDYEYSDEEEEEYYDDEEEEWGEEEEAEVPVVVVPKKTRGRLVRKNTINNNH
jgi:hypothetical protein